MKSITHTTFHRLALRARVSSHLAVAFALALILPCGLSLAEETERHVETVGVAERVVPVDTVTWAVLVRAVAPSVAEAATELEQSMNALHERVAGLEPDQVQARGSLVRTGRETRRVDGEDQFVGYFAFCHVRLECRDLDQMTAVQALLLTDDRISISSITGSHSEASEIKQEVLREAALAARNKARMLAELMDCELGEPLMIAEGNRGNRTNVTLTANRIEMPEFAQGTRIDFDHLTITEVVTVRFSLQPAN